MSLQAAIEHFFKERIPAPPGATVLVALSGGPDSAALLHGLTALSGRLDISVVAAHLDHALDPDSAGRARRADRLAATLGVGLTSSRRPVTALRRSGESPEAAARRVRYAFLEEVATELGASFIATAHHADDQAETVLLRMLYGTGLRGLGAISPARGRIVRPLLELDRPTIERYVARHGLPVIDDPTNRDLESPRNRIRHLLGPHLRRTDPALDHRLRSLAASARAATAALDRRLLEHLNAKVGELGGVSDAAALRALPAEVRRVAIGALCALVGAPAPSSSALGEIERQHKSSRPLGCDLGDGWRLESGGGRLLLFRPPPEAAPFAYTVEVPGEILIEELSLTLRLARRPIAPWMFRGSKRRAGLAAKLDEGEVVTVRSRRPGDRIRPLGCTYSKRLKDVLIDRKVPRSERDRLPLLCIDSRIVWVPGVTIDERARLTASETSAWVAEIEPAT